MINSTCIVSLNMNISYSGGTYAMTDEHSADEQYNFKTLLMRQQKNISLNL